MKGLWAWAAWKLEEWPRFRTELLHPFKRRTVAQWAVLWIGLVPIGLAVPRDLYSMEGLWLVLAGTPWMVRAMFLLMLEGGEEGRSIDDLTGLRAVRSWLITIACMVTCFLPWLLGVV